MSQKPIRPTIEYIAQIWQEGEQYVAQAMPIDVISSGRTPDEARSALGEAVDLFILTSEDLGTLTEVLEEAGYALVGGEWHSPTWVGFERRTARLAS